MIAKLCLECFRHHFGDDAKIHTVTWSAQCSSCHKETPPRGLLIKADLVATMAHA
jgi:hypothetical protein